MERLVEIFEKNDAMYICLTKCKEHCQNNHDPSCHCDNNLEVWEKLAEYEELESQGLLLKLPCKVGDTVYELQSLRRCVQEYTIISIRVSKCSISYVWELKDGKGVYGNIYGFEEFAIGKTVFLTQEAAEKALKEMEK